MGSICTKSSNQEADEPGRQPLMQDATNVALSPSGLSSSIPDESVAIQPSDVLSSLPPNKAEDYHTVLAILKSQDTTAQGWSNKTVEIVMASVEMSREIISMVANAILPPPGGAVVGAVLGMVHMIVQQTVCNADMLDLTCRATSHLNNICRFWSSLKRSKLEICLQEFHSTLLAITKLYKGVKDMNMLTKLLSSTKVMIEIKECRDNMQNAISDLMIGVQLDGHELILEDHKMLVEVKRMMDNSQKFSLELKQSLQNIAVGVQNIGENQESAAVNRYIKFPEMNSFWRKHFHMLEKVKWEIFWERFLGKGSGFTAEQQERLTEMFGSPSSFSKETEEMACFRCAVEKEIDSCISVVEVQDAFDLHLELDNQEFTVKILDLIDQGRNNGGSKCNVPTLPFKHEEFIGREVALRDIGLWMANKPDTDRILVVSGPPGNGKFSAVTVAAKKAFSDGGFKGGVFHLNWPEYVDALQMEFTLLAGLSGIYRQGRNLQARLGELRKERLPVLLLIFKVDLRRTSRSHFKKALAKIMTLLLLKVVITSQDASVGTLDQGPESTLICIKPLDDASAVKMLEQAASPQKLLEEDSKEISKRLGYSAVLLRLIGHCISNGQMTSDEAKAMDVSRIDDAVGSLYNDDRKSEMMAILKPLVSILKKQLQPVRKTLLTLSLFPEYFTLKSARRVCGPTCDGPIKALLSSFLVEYTSSPLSMDASSTFLIQAEVKNAINVMVSRHSDDDTLRGKLNVSVADRDKYVLELEEAQIVFVAFCESRLRKCTKGYETFSPLAAFHNAIKLQPMIEKALMLIEGNPGIHIAAAISLLPLLTIIPVSYRKQLFKNVCTKLVEVCGEFNPLGTAVALLADSTISEDEKASWGQCRDKAVAAQSLLAKLDADTPGLALLKAKACRSEGLLRRQLGDYKGSVAAYINAQDQANLAPEIEGQAEWILDTAELSGTYDYMKDLDNADSAADLALLRAQAFYSYETEASCSGESSSETSLKHPYLALAYTALGYNQNSRGRFEGALQSHTTAMEIRKAVLGDFSLEVALSQNQMAISNKNLGKLSESEVLFKESLEIRILCKGDDDVLVANTHFQMSEVLIMQAKKERQQDKKYAAISHARKSLDIRTKKLPAGDTKIADAQKRLDQIQASPDFY